MNLLSISASNFKGLTFSEDLADVTIFGGSNFVGKTARLDAIRLLLIGYLPELGKTNRGTFGLSSGSEMAVEGVIADGDKRVTIRRTWKLKGDTIKAESNIPAELEGSFGSGSLAVMMDPAVYFELTESQRVKYVFDHCRTPADWTPQAVVARLAAEHPTFRCPPIGNDSFASGSDAGDTQAFLTLTIDTLAEVEKAAKDAAGRMEKTIQGLSALRSADVQSGPTERMLADEETKLRARVAELNTERGAKMGEGLAIEKARTRRAAIRRELDGKANAERELEAEGTRFRSLIHEYNTISLHDPKVRLDLQKTLDDDRLVQARSDSALGHAREVTRRSMISLDEIHGQKVCPYCGATGEGWKALRSQELIDTIETLRLTIEVEEANQKALAATIRESVRLLNADSEASVRRAELKALCDGLYAKMNTLRAKIDRATDLQAELDNLPAENPELETARVMIETELRTSDARLREIATVRRNLTSRSQDLRRLAEAEESRDRFQIEAKNSAAIRASALALREEIVEGTFKLLLTEANKFFPLVLKTPIDYHKGEVGTWRGSLWVSHATFSGTERSLVFAAIQAALAARAPVRVLMIDELARIHDDLFAEFFTGVELAIEQGRIDQFVGVDPSRAARYESTDTFKRGFAYLKIEAPVAPDEIP